MSFQRALATLIFSLIVALTFWPQVTVLLLQIVLWFLWIVLLIDAFSTQRRAYRMECNRKKNPLSAEAIVTYLEENGPTPGKQLCEYFGVDATAIMPFVDRLERVGRVEGIWTPKNRIWQIKKGQGEQR